MNKIYYFLQDYDPQGSYPGHIVALSAEVCYELEKSGISYTILEDYYTETNLRKDADRYFEEERLWVLKLDELLRQEIPEARLLRTGLATAHFNRLQYLIDSAVIRTRILSYFLNSQKPAKVILVEKKSSEESPAASIYNFKSPIRQSCALFLKALSQQSLPAAFEFESIVFQDAKAAGRGLRNKKDYDLPAFLRPWAKRFMLFFRYQLWKAWFSVGKRSNPLKILFLDGGTWAIDEVVRQAVRRNSEIWFKNKLEMTPLISQKSFREESLCVEGPDVAESFLENRESLRARFHAECQRWINDQAGADIGEILEPYFVNFFEEIIPSVLLEIRAMRKFYEEKKINAVFARASVGENYTAALLSAEAVQVPRVCYQHSIGALDVKGWGMDELALFDTNFAMHPMSRDYFEKSVKTCAPHGCQTLFSEHYLKSIEYQCLQRKVRGRGIATRPCVYYVPNKLAHGAVRMDLLSYSTPWYYRHQKKLFETFSQDNRYQFIFKHARHQRWEELSLLKWLREKNYSNIQIQDGPLPEYLPLADRMIFDFSSSTGVFEAAAAGVSLLVLHPAAGPRLWPACGDWLGESLQVFTDTADAQNKIRMFLNADPEKFVVKLPLSDRDEINAGFSRAFDSLRISHEELTYA